MPAEINIRPEIALGIKQTDAMNNLGSLLNTANALQQFKQTQQTNPLQLEREQQLVEQAKTQTKKSAFDFQQQHENIANSAISALIASPHFKPDESGQYNSQAMLQDIDAVERMVKAQGVKSSPGGAADILREKIKKDPKEAAQFLQNVAISQISPESKVGLVKPANMTLNGMPAVQDQLTGEIRPATIKGGEAAPVKSKPEVSEEYKSLRYPTRKAGDIRPQDFSEQVERTYGQKYIEKLADTNSPTALQDTKRSLNAVDEQIKNITDKAIKAGWISSDSGLFGAGVRKLDDLIGNGEYKLLSKDLARLRLSQLNAMPGGAQSVEAIKLNQDATGDVTYPPKVLQEIKDRIASSVTGNELENTAAQKFASNFGEANMKLFQRQWTENSDDGKIFQAMNIYNKYGNTDEAKKMIHELLGPPGSSKFKNNYQKFENINDLINYGYISKKK